MTNNTRTYILFGNDHVHYINGKLFDKDCVGVISCTSHKEGRVIARKMFGTDFALVYTGSYFNSKEYNEFHRGFISVRVNGV